MKLYVAHLYEGERVNERRKMVKDAITAQNNEEQEQICILAERPYKKKIQNKLVLTRSPYPLPTGQGKYEGHPKSKFTRHITPIKVQHCVAPAERHLSV